MKTRVLALLSILLISSVARAEDCADRPECWPEGSSMHTGLLLVEELKGLDQTLARLHTRLLELVAQSKSDDGIRQTDGRLLEALKTQQTAWLVYRSAECELIGSLTGAAATWQSTYANKCERNHTELRIRRVRAATRCIERFTGDARLSEQSNCLQQLAPLTNRL